MDRGNAECRVYVGNLPSDVKAKELDDLFYKYGTIKDISLKKDTRGGQPFAFIEFEDPRYFFLEIFIFCNYIEYCSVCQNIIVFL